MSRGTKHIVWISVLMSMGLSMWSCNPFAPAYDPEGLSQVNVLGDPRSIEGYFKRFKNAYELRDTTLYGALFSTDFAFAFYDQELGQEILESTDY